MAVFSNIKHLILEILFNDTTEGNKKPSLVMNPKRRREL